MKYMVQITPVSLYDLAGLEAWLDEQGAKGLFPTFVGESVSCFQRQDIPSGTRFRLAAMDKHEEPREEMRQLYHECGWSYCRSIGGIWLLFWAADPQIPEPYSDPITQGYGLDVLTHRIRSSFLRQGIALVLLVALFVFLFYSDSRFDVQPSNPWLYFQIFIIDLLGFYLLLLIILLFSFGNSVSNSIRLIRMRHQMAQGLDQVSFPKTHLKARNVICLITLCLIALFAIPYRLWIQPIPLERATFPYLSLQELEDIPMDSFEHLHGPSSFHEDDNQMVRSFSLLAPIYYSTTQESYEIPLDETETRKGFSTDLTQEYWYCATLDATYYHLTIPSMARSVAESKLDKLRLVNLYWSYEEIFYPGTDFVILGHDSAQGNYKMAAVANGGKLVVLCYGGAQELTDHLDKLAALVA